MGKCAICEGDTVRGFYWVRLDGRDARQLAVPAAECVCGSLVPDDDFVFAMAADVPERLVRDALERRRRVANGSGPRLVMIVDDDRETRAVMRRILASHGCDVVDAEDGVDALGALAVLASAGRVPELVFVDSVMPRMPGAEFLRAMRAQYPSVIAIACSGAHASLPLADGSLPKPIRPEVVRSVIRDFCP